MQEMKLISLNSANSTYKNNSTYLSDVEFYFPNLLISNDNIEKVELILSHAEIPVSFYTINYTNSWFKYKLDTDPIINVQVPVGNYNANTLITAILTLINDANFEITISKITGRLTWHHNKTFNIYTDNTYSIGKVLGFELNQIYTSTSLPNYTLNTPYPLNLLGIKKINIESSELFTNNITSFNSSTLSLIQSLPVDQPSFGLIIYENKTGTTNLLKVKELNKIDIKMTDEGHNLINFNNIDWTLLFNLIVTYSIPQPSPQVQPVEKPLEIDTKTNNTIKDLEFLQTN